jgi:hypothetical protein
MSPRAIIGLLALPAVFNFAAEASAQGLVATVTGKSGQHLGGSFAAGPDLDGDGIGDVAIGAPGKALGAVGTVQVLSGRDFTKIVELTGAANEYFGSSVAWCGDLDGDGISELAVGLPGWSNGVGEIQIFSPSTWGVLRTLTSSGSGVLGLALVACGDYDGDGFDDLLASAPRSNAVGEVLRFSGKDGSILQTITGTTARAEFGSALVLAGDVDGDGIVDVAIGSPDLDVTSHNENSGAVEVRSGANGSLLWQQIGTYLTIKDPWGGTTYIGDQLGFALDGAGDLDVDGVADLAVMTNGALYFEILSGKDGSNLRTVTPLFTRGGLGALGDLTGDGLPELGVSFYESRETFAIYSSLDAKVLWRTDALIDTTQVVGKIPDVNGDGLPDFVLGLPYTGSDIHGRAELRTTNDLWLDASTHRPDVFHRYLTLRANEGVPGNLAALVLTGINGLPKFEILAFATFDATGSALLVNAVAVPPGLAGLLIDLRAIAIGSSGRLIQSADEEIAPQ